MNISAIFTFLSIASCLGLAPDSNPAPPKAPPNVVLLIADDMGYRDYGFMGHHQIQTPRLDRLARQSLIFRRGYVTSSLCSPSLASILTGAIPTSTRSPAMTLPCPAEFPPPPPRSIRRFWLRGGR